MSTGSESGTASDGLLGARSVRLTRTGWSVSLLIVMGKLPSELESVTASGPAIEMRARSRSARRSAARAAARPSVAKHAPSDSEHLGDVAGVSGLDVGAVGGDAADQVGGRGGVGGRIDLVGADRRGLRGAWHGAVVLRELLVHEVLEADAVDVRRVEHLVERGAAEPAGVPWPDR